MFGVCEEVDEGRSNCTKLRDEFLRHFDRFASFKKNVGILEVWKQYRVSQM